MKIKTRIEIIGLVFLANLVVMTATALADEHTINGQTGSLHEHTISDTDTIYYNPGAEGTTQFVMTCIFPYCGVQRKIEAVNFYWKSNVSPTWTYWTTQDFVASVTVPLMIGSSGVQYKIVIKRYDWLSYILSNIEFTK